MIEKAVTFGGSVPLVGVVTQPRGGAGDRPAVLFWNVGTLHRVGPHRLQVDLARRLAGMGFPTLRFDLSGRGDSPPRTDALSNEDRVIDDIRKAMDFLQKRLGVERFVLMGICSGADDVHRTTVADPRVVGGLMVDGYGYPTFRFRLRRYTSFACDPYRVYKFLKRRLHMAWARVSGGRGPRPQWQLTFWWTPPPKAKVMAELQSLIDRGCALLFIYTADVHRYYSYAEQFRDMYRELDFRDLVEYDFAADADHLFSLPGRRDRLMNRVSDWMEARFGG